jgi:predicted CoA-binding protein
MPIDRDDKLREILLESRTIAVVGASQKPWRDSNRIMQFLMNAGYEVHPVNPAYDEVLGRRCYPDLGTVPASIDIVDVFRNASAVPEITRAAVAAKAKTLWLQSGIIHTEAASQAEEAGLQVVMDRCIAVDYRRLID